MILFGIILTSIGIMVFLFAVDAFLDSDIKRFMTILNVILIFALLGVTIRNIIEWLGNTNSIHLSFSLAYNVRIHSSLSLTMAPSRRSLYSQQCKSP